MLSALSDRWRPLFATAIYTGMRRGELLGLRKGDVDLASGLIGISRSHGRDTTKGSRAEAIPVARELVPYLQHALARSLVDSELVFPKEDGTMMRPDVALEGVLRRALGRAGIVRGYVHVCRKKGCGHAERAADASQRVSGRDSFAKPRRPRVEARCGFSAMCPVAAAYPTRDEFTPNSLRSRSTLGGCG